MPISEDFHKILKKHWGYDNFRPLQEEIIQSVVDGHDTLGLMPTGGGKSITFQVPGMYLPDGVTIVITPLISLMKDQVDNLKQRRIKAVMLHSGMRHSESRIAWEMLFNGKARFLYISPERLHNDRFLLELRHLKVNLITVDEAHCISQWGYDFRPSYLNIKKLRKLKPDVPVLALTATATPKVVCDIMEQLEFRNHKFFKKSFSRENINYIVRTADTKITEVLHILTRTTGSAIVYVRSRKRCKEISEYLENAGISSSYYHAGIDNAEKVERQNLWKSDKIRVIVATNAFGMGIDKADVRTVIHYDLPPSLEEYYQEAGRVGRDGKTSYAVLLYSNSDKAVLRRKVTESFPDRAVIKKTYERICNYLHYSIGEGFDKISEFDILKFCSLFKISERQCRASLRLLEQAGYMQFIEDYDKRSRLRIIVEREELYELKGISKTAIDVLSASLRLYTGLFIDYSFIRENEIANSLKLTQQEIYKAFLELNRNKIVSYIPRSGLPMIYLPTAREETSSLLIGKDIYEKRINDISARAEAVIGYAQFQKGCRVKEMLSYFGEENACDCGKCDRCREKKKTFKTENAKLENKIFEIYNFIKSDPSGVLLQKIQKHIGNSDFTSKALSYLCNEGFIEFRENKYFSSKT